MKRLSIAALAWFLAACAHTPVTPAYAPSPVPSAFNQQIRNAHNAIDAGDGDYQLKTLRERAAAEPENADVRVELIRAYRDRSYPDIALEMARLAAARFPQNEAIQLELVRSLRDMNQRNEAISLLDGYLKSHPGAGAAAFSWLGILYDESGQWAMGEPEDRKAVELSPTTAYLHNNLGYNLLMQKKNADAAAEFREAMRLDPSSQLARNNLGTALAAENDTRDALENWRSTSDPATAHNNLAAVYIEKGNYPEARKELEIALGYNRLHPAALKNLELVSRLDGNAATMPGKETETRWERWKAGFLRLFVGPLDDSRATPR